ncbi:MAG: type I secretion C-terminal target domain-containing protein [Candidatus Thiodiazotropha sp. (ex Lucinoma kastoroae)]|nr:type I secretion C-terminal target domain-containing protein [Candidatus Thiodiazotropha sp. (ex Lucinoma kastoroae)]
MVDSKLFNAILSMDAYNRGYQAGIQFEVNGQGLSTGQQIGNVTIANESDIASGSEERDAGFYAVEYQVAGLGSVISYRGTDQALGSIPFFFEAPSGSDIWNGWGTAIGSTSANQSGMAFEFFNSVIGSTDPRLANVITTGHSLGGGLAGLVAGAHGLEGDLFDNMPFESALAQTNNVANFSTELQNLIYQGSTTPWDTNLDTIQSISLDGEVLSPFRTTDIEYSFDTSIHLDDGTILDESIARHSMSALVIRMFADTELAGSVTWEPAAKYFWPLLFNDNFAGEIGFNGDNSGIIGGVKLTNGESADVLRQTIAYSAIDEGTRVFGDTGIRALYNDVNPLGTALTTSANNQTHLDQYAVDISKTLLQFAGSLALHKVEQADSASATNTVNGVLTLNAAGLYVDLSDNTWEPVTNTNAGGNAGLLDRRSELITNILSSSDYDPSDVANIPELINQAWSASSVSLPYEMFQKIVFGLDENNSAQSLLEEDTSVQRATLYVTPTTDAAFTGTTSVYGTNEQELFLGNDHDNSFSTAGGNDIIMGFGGNDFLYGRGNNDILDGGAGNDSLYGGNGIDTVDYSHQTVALTGNLGAGAVLIDQSGGSDTLVSIETVIATDYDDDLTVLNLNDQTIYGGEGFDTINATAYGTYYKIAETDSATYFDFYGNKYLKAVDFENIIDDPDYEIVHNQTTYNNFELVVDNQGNEGLDVFRDRLDYTGATSALVHDARGENAGGFVPLYAGQSNTIGLPYTYYTVTGGSINHELYKPSIVYGSHHGDTFTMDLRSHATHFVLGRGDDTVNILSDATWAPYVLTYTGGNDTYTTKDMLSEIRLVDTIMLEDVSINFTAVNSYSFSAVITIQDHGVINLNYDFRPEHTINITLESGGQISFKSPWSGGYNDYFYEISGQSFVQNIVNGTWGDDNLNSRTGYAQELIGLGGNDTLYGYDMDDFLYGGMGDDLLDGGTGVDYLFGGVGADTLIGGIGNDRIYGGHGSDEFIFGAGFGDDYIYDFEVGEKLNLSSIGSITDINNLTIAASGAHTLITVGTEGSILVYDIDSSYWTNSDFVFAQTGTSSGERIDGDAYWNNINGLAGLDYLFGYGGNDTIYGGYGEDRLYGGDGDDVLNGERDNDRIYGHLGDDTIYGDHGWDQLYGLQGDDLIYGGIGNDLIRGDDDSALDTYIGAGNDEIHGGDGSDNISGGAGNDLLYGDAGNDYIYGNAGSDEIHGGDHVDRLYGLDGSDTIYGDAGNDYLYAGTGSDLLYGGTGVDRIYGHEGNDVIYGGDDTDYIYGLEDNDTMYGEGGNDIIYAHDGDDILDGGIGNDQLYGLQGNDTLYGGAGADRLIGDDDPATAGFVGAGNDTLYGDADNDVINGGAGDDLLYGGTGFDNLYGSVGADTFAFASGDLDGNRDIIHDFSAVDGDTINIADVIDFNSANGDVISDFVFIVDGSYHTKWNIDQDGTGTTYGVTVLTQIQNGIGMDLNTIVGNGTLIVE